MTTSLLIFSLILNIVLLVLSLRFYAKTDERISLNLKSRKKQSVWTDKTFGKLIFTAPKKL